MSLGLSFLLGFVASSVCYFIVGLSWPIALIIGVFAWLAFSLFGVKMDSAFTLMSGALLVFCISFVGMIMMAMNQLSALQFAETVNEEGTGFRYPLQMTSDVLRGEKAYRSVGCYACHTQQVRHDDVQFDIKAKTSQANHLAVKDALKSFYKVINQTSSAGSVLGFPVDEWEMIAQGLTPNEATKARNFLSKAGASLDLQVRFRGEDLMKDEYFNAEGRGWGKRRSVARDYLFVERPMLGSLRIGPDLANVGTRQSKDVMIQRLFKRHRFLFEEINGLEDDKTIVIKKDDKKYKPTQEAIDLVAYLSSLKGANYPLNEAPIYQPFTSSIPEPVKITTQESDQETTGIAQNK